MHLIHVNGFGPFVFGGSGIINVLFRCLGQLPLLLYSLSPLHYISDLAMSCRDLSREIMCELNLLAIGRHVEW